MVAYPKRLRYTHKIYIYKQLNTIFDGVLTSSISIIGYPDDQDFRISIYADNTCRIKITGSLNGTSVTERISFGQSDTKYTNNYFDTITSITSDYFEANTNVTLEAVDSVGMPLTWNQTYGPYKAEFGSHSGMSAQVEASSLGLGSKTIHYVRIERSAPVSHNMEFTVSGFDGIIFVPISDFENISTPPSYVPQEWAFRAVTKEGIKTTV